MTLQPIKGWVSNFSNTWDYDHMTNSNFSTFYTHCQRLEWFSVRLYYLHAYSNGFLILLIIKFLGILEDILWFLVNLLSLFFVSVETLVTVTLNDPWGCITEQQYLIFYTRGSCARKKGKMGLGSLELFKVGKQMTSSYLVFTNPLGSNVKLALGYRKLRLCMSPPGLAQPPNAAFART